MKPRKLASVPTIKRLPSYLHVIEQAQREGKENISGTVIADELELEPGRGGEIQLTDAMNRLGQEGKLKGAITDQEFLDVGNPLGLLRASMVLGNNQFPEFADIVRAELDLQ